MGHNALTVKNFKTHYDNLQVTENASPEVIRGAYRSLAQKWHPDRNPEQREEAERITRLLNAAYAVLSDPERRREHDRWIREQQRMEARQTLQPTSWPAPRPAVRNEFQYRSPHRTAGRFGQAWLILLFVAFVAIFLFVFPDRARILLVVFIWLGAGGYACSVLFDPVIPEEEAWQGSVQMQEAILRREATGVGWLMVFISCPLAVAILMLVGLPFARAGVIALIIAIIVGLLSWTLMMVSRRP